MIRRILDESSKYYNLEFKTYNPLSSKAYKVKSDNGEEYFLKETELYMQEKFKFLYNQGINNILYPIKNRAGEYITKCSGTFYVTNFVSDFYTVNEIKAASLLGELNYLHTNTFYKRQLSPLKSREKMDSIFEYLQYKFALIEVFVRSVEARPFDEYSITILKNYQYILDAKKVMANLQRKVITAIKEKRSINYSFIHNNPKLDHLLSYNGSQYLISIEKAKIGVPSLDIAKFYVESEDLNFDIKAIIQSYFSKYEDPFYYDYFCFLVLFIYIKGLVIVDKDYVSSQNFIYTASSIKTFIATFSLIPERENDT